MVVDEISIYKLPLEKLADFRREYLGFIFQSFQLIPYLTVIENVMLPLSITERSNREQTKMAEEILEKIGLKGKAKRLPDQLSGGEQERVAIARALVNSPPILLADEPPGTSIPKQERRSWTYSRLSIKRDRRSSWSPIIRRIWPIQPERSFSKMEEWTGMVQTLGRVSRITGSTKKRGSCNEKMPRMSNKELG